MLIGNLGDTSDALQSVAITSSRGDALPRVFVSHCHEDKSIARRIVRFLRAYAVDAWLDERELRLGARLDDAIRRAIEASDAVVVVATQAAARSRWVDREVAFASNSSPPIPVCPVYVDDVISHPSFAPHLGIDAADRHQFVDRLVRLAETFAGSPLPQPDTQQLEANLDELARQDSGVALLVESCLCGQGLAYEHVQLVSEISFHNLDDALDLISRLGGGYAAAHATAALFGRTGAGSAALARYVLAGHDLLVYAVGTVLDATLLDTAIRLLSVPNPRDDQALASFLWKNADALAAKYHAEVVRLVTHPRRAPAGFGADMAAAAFRVFPDDSDLMMLWSRWIREGLFDMHVTSGAGASQAFAHWCSRGLQAGSSGWGQVFDSFVEHVRRLARTQSRPAIRSAVGHMMFAADKDNPRLGELVRACQAATGAAEWDGWAEREEMSLYVQELTTEALGERSWGAALGRFAKAREAQRAVRNAIDDPDKYDDQ